ncbi:hypothetical protein H9L39_11818 [Fusarium oxysporum f. sp. albedinis]|nr:hypothetical protein H9L39_11818 [Fusarium oxysporum f. sp. albedinis]
MIYVLFELRIRIYFTGLPRPSVTSIAKLKKFIEHGVTVASPFSVCSSGKENPRCVPRFLLSVGDSTSQLISFLFLPTSDYS